MALVKKLSHITANNLHKGRYFHIFLCFLLFQVAVSRTHSHLPGRLPFLSGSHVRLVVFAVAAWMGRGLAATHRSVFLFGLARTTSGRTARRRPPCSHKPGPPAQGAVQVLGQPGFCTGAVARQAPQVRRRPSAALPMARNSESDLPSRWAARQLERGGPSRSRQRTSAAPGFFSPINFTRLHVTFYDVP